MIIIRICNNNTESTCNNNNNNNPDLYTESGQTLEGAFSAVSKPIFAIKDWSENSPRDLLGPQYVNSSSWLANSPVGVIVEGHLALFGAAAEGNSRRRVGDDEADPLGSLHPQQAEEEPDAGLRTPVNNFE